MEFEGEFKVPGAPEEVIREFADVERMAKLMPGASIEGRDEEGNYLGVMTVAFGPKRIKFKGKVTVEIDEAAKSGKLRGRGAADLRAARIETRLNYQLHADPSAATPTTIVRLKAEADMQGVLAEFAKTGGEAVGNVLMAEFAKNLAAEIGSEKPAAIIAGEGAPEMSSPPATTAKAPQQAAALSATGLMWRVIKMKACQMMGLGKK
jgi:carbon monoxide dehydrogenase subunit G